MNKKLVFLPYDFDTALGIDNVGQLTFDYRVEDTDIIEDAEAFHGQSSVLWKNIRDAFQPELTSMYQTLRSTGAITYDKVEQSFEEHQSKWPEAIFNEDAYFKYLQPLIEDNDASYLEMLLGSKKEQRKWWLYNRFRYIDSKYNAGDNQTDYVTLRIYAKADMTITPYADIYPSVKFGSYMVKSRGQRNQPTVLSCPVESPNGLETYIYSASQIRSFGDLSAFKVGYCDFSRATKMQELKLGDADASYRNGQLTNVVLGNNVLLKKIDVRNCPNLTEPVNMSNCTNIEEAYFDGTAVTSVTLPNGGILKKLHLPDTVTSLSLINQTALTEFVLNDSSNVETLILENVPASVVNAKALLMATPANARIRIIGFSWDFDSYEDIVTFYDFLDQRKGIRGITDYPNPIMSGTIHVPSISTEQIRQLQLRYGDINITADALTYSARFYNGDTLLYVQPVNEGDTPSDPVTAGLIPEPTKPISGNIAYTYNGWDNAFTPVTGDVEFHAVYLETAICTVTFNDWDGTKLYEANVAQGGNVPDPVANHTIETPTRPVDENYSYTYKGWSSSLNNITASKTVVATYNTTPSVCITFVNYDGTKLYETYVANGSGIADPITSGLIETPTKPEDTTAQATYAYNGWNKTFSNVTANTTVTATYTATYYAYATFLNYDGTQLGKERYNVGTLIADPVQAHRIATPTRASGTGEDFNYIYKGWDQTFPYTLNANTSFTAQFKTDKMFTLTFYDWDGTTVLNTQSVVDEGDGVDPVATSVIGTPTRESTAQYTYTYTGWSNSGKWLNVTQDQTFTAQYSQTTRTYTVTFYKDRGDTTSVYSTTVNYGGTASLPSTNPTKDDAEFAGWEDTYKNVTADVSVYAKWNYTVEVVEITDSWDTILAAIDDGTYKTKYKIGNYKPLDLGTEGTVNMQIVAFDADELTSGGAAPVTMISKELLANQREMNSSKITEGGWPATQMRSELSTVIKPLIPANVASRIKTVKKYSWDANTSTELVSNDDLWIPSGREVGNAISDIEISGPDYTTVFKDNASRIKERSSSTSYWWLRSAISSINFYYVNRSGHPGNGNGANNMYSVALGFCLGTSEIEDSWDDIIAAANDGTYATKYNIGDWKSLDLGSEGVAQMQIVGVNCDELADGSGMAAMSFVSKNLLANSRQMNSSNTTEGGWPASKMRSELSTVIKPLIPANVANGIKTVKKYSWDANTSTELVSNDDLWIPSRREVGTAISGIETSGPDYTTIFKDNASRIKKKGSAAYSWWLRSAISSANFRRVNASGDPDTIGNASNRYGVALGFSI